MMQATEAVNGGGRALPTIESRALALAVVALTWCLGLIAVRVYRTESPHFLFLIWNLFLACVPLASSRALASASRSGASRMTQLALFCLWLLFLPNAPYIVTDLIHVSPRAGGALSWYDAGMVLSCAATGLLVGYLSLRDMQRWIEARLGTVAGWSMAVCASLLSGFGVYLGRVMRWNSWDVFISPVALFGSVADFLADPHLHLYSYAVTLLFGIGLLLGYAALHFLAFAERGVR